MSIARYYAWLSRFQDAARGVRHDAGQHTFTVHRHLRDDDGASSGDVLHHAIVAALAHSDERATASSADRGTTVTAQRGAAAPLEVLDAGCGLGGTLLFLHAAIGARGVGITLSPDQQARAAAEAQRRGVADACRFVVRDYDHDLSDLMPSGVDVVIAIESLAHAPAPAATIGRLAARLRPGGRLLIVDDVPDDTLARDDADFAAFRQGWLCPAIATGGALESALEAAGLAPVYDLDLTSRLQQRGDVALTALSWMTRLADAALSRTSLHLLLGALHGGLRLERLYRRGVMRYRLIVARRRCDV